MKRSRIMGTFGVIGLTAVIAGGSTLAQSPGRRAQSQATPVSPFRTDDQELIGHALSMAIESSGLISGAQQARSGGAQGHPVVEDGEGKSSGGLLGDILPDVRGEKGSGKETAPQKSGARTTGATGAPAPAKAERQPTARQDTAPRSEVISDVRSTQIQEQARRGFEDSERLFGAAAQRIGGHDALLGRYMNAARAYARTLESLAGWSGGAEERRGAAGGDAAAGRPTMISSDGQSVCLANHAIKELIESRRLRTICWLTGNRAGASEVLRQHAQQMHASATRTLQALADPATARTLGSATGALVRQAQELALVLDEMDRIGP
jgi:hypothetical protein